MLVKIQTIPPEYRRESLGLMMMHLQRRGSQMTDRELLYIKTIAEERNISAAAKKLFMTQPALSHCLGSLEQETGTPVTGNGNR